MLGSVDVALREAWGLEVGESEGDRGGDCAGDCDGDSFPEFEEFDDLRDASVIV